MNGTSIQNIIVAIGTVLTGIGGAFGGVQLLRKMQKDYLNTAASRNQQQETTIQEQNEENGRLVKTNLRLQSAQFDRMELARLLEAAGGKIPQYIQQRIDRDSEGL